MTLSEAVVLLRGLAPGFLEGLTPSERTALFETAAISRFEPGSLITRQGFPADALALMVQGRARFCLHNDRGPEAEPSLDLPGRGLRHGGAIVGTAQLSFKRRSGKTERGPGLASLCDPFFCGELSPDTRQRVAVGV